MLYVLVCALYVITCYVDLLFDLSRYVIMWLLWIVYLAYSQWVETLSLESSLRYQRIPKWYQVITSIFKERKKYLESKRKPIGIIGRIFILSNSIERKYIHMNRSCRVNSCCEVLAELSFAYSYIDCLLFRGEFIAPLLLAFIFEWFLNLGEKTCYPFLDLL